MPTKRANVSTVESHYDAEYHQGHFGALLEDNLNHYLLSLYWRYVLFEQHLSDAGARALDYGSGIGQVSATLGDSVCLDISAATMPPIPSAHTKSVPIGSSDMRKIARPASVP